MFQVSDRTLLIDLPFTETPHSLSVKLAQLVGVDRQIRPLPVKDGSDACGGEFPAEAPPPQGCRVSARTNRDWKNRPA